MRERGNGAEPRTRGDGPQHSAGKEPSAPLLGHATTSEDIDAAVLAFPKAVERLRGLSRSAASSIPSPVCDNRGVRVLVGLSGGVDSSVAAGLLLEQGHDVVGATMKLWGGAGDSGCCSVGDVEDARRVAARLGIDHHVFNFSEEFEHMVVEPYAEAHARGRTPNPCIECNRHLKFRRFLDRALRLGFDAVATGHHARVANDPTNGVPRLLRGRDLAKDQSYVLSMLMVADLERVLLPVGEMTKTQVRSRAVAMGLPTALKPDSQEVCFVAAGAGSGPARGIFGRAHRAASRTPCRARERETSWDSSLRSSS